MSGKRAADPSPFTSFRESSVYLLKAQYQRNMLIGLVLATIIVTVPCLLIGWWPASADTEPPICLTPPIDSVIVDLIIEDQIKIIRDKSGGGRPRVDDHSTGFLVEHVITLPDSALDPLEDRGFDQGDFTYDDIDEDPSFGTFGSGNGTIYFLDSGVYDISDNLDRLPTLITMPEPIYPLAAKRLGAEGIVVLLIVIDPYGAVTRIEVQTDTNPGYGFATAAKEAAHAAAFTPAYRNHQPVRCRVTLPVEFVLTK